MKRKPSSLVGRTLMDVLASARPLEGEGIPGLGQPLYYSVVLRLDSGESFSLSGADLRPWAETEALVPVTTASFDLDPAVVFRSQTVVAVTEDDVGDLVIVLENQTTLSVRVSYGTIIDLKAPGAHGVE